MNECRQRQTNAQINRAGGGGGVSGRWGGGGSRKTLEEQEKPGSVKDS